MVGRKEFEIEVADGYRLAATSYESEQSESLNLSVQINNAMGLHQGFYQAFATFLAEHGVFVLTYDNRAIGRSSRVPASEDPSRLSDWGDKDLAGVTEWLARARPESKLVSVCHSLGAPLLGLAPNSTAFSAVVVIASGTGYWRNWKGWDCIRLLFGWHVLIPAIVAAKGYLPARYFGSDLPRGIALDWAKWCQHPQGYPLTEGLGRIKVPTLFYSFSDDNYSPPAAVANLINSFSGAQITHRQIAPKDMEMKSLGHFGFFKKTMPESAWMHVLQWMKAAAWQGAE